MPKKKQIHIEYRLSQNYLSSKNITNDNIERELKYLMKLFGLKYEKLFHKDLYREQDIEFIFHCSSIFKKIKSCSGFDRFIKQYDNHNHLFTAKVAGYLLYRGYSVELEPDMGKKDGGHPDLKLEKDEQEIFAECKTSEISNLYAKAEKQQIADFVYQQIPTCDQITFFLKDEAGFSLIQELLRDSVVRKQILKCYAHGKDNQESSIQIHGSVEVRVLQKPAIIGAEKDFLTVTMAGYMEDNITGTRSIGFAFMKGGRAIGVYSVVDYKNRWKNKMEQSEHQLVDDYPNIVFVDGGDVVGDPVIHQKYFDDVWLTKDLSKCSAVVLFHQYRNPASSELVERVDIFDNKHAINKIDSKALVGHTSEEY